MGMAATHRIAPSVWLQLGSLACGNPLLPNLRELGWVISTPQCIGLLSFLTPTLTRLRFVCLGIDTNDAPGDRRGWQSILQALLQYTFQAAPGITSLTITTGQIDYFTPHLSNLHSLRYFRGDRVDIRTLHALATLINLEELYVSQFVTTDETPASFSGFSRLKVLTIIDHPLTNLIYGAFASPQLEQLYIVSYPDQRYLDVASSCSIWAHRFPSLRVLSLNIYWEDDLTEPRPLRDGVAPLLALRNIQIASITSLYTTFSIGDDDIAAFAQAWPRLKSLNLCYSSGGCGPGWPPMPSPTPSSFLALATSCPDLKEVRVRRIVVRHDTLPDLDKIDALPRQHGLECLDTQHGDLEDAMVPEFAQWLDRLFPHLATHSFNATWKRVLDAIRDCQTERTQRQSS